MSETMREQYEEIAEAIEVDGLGSAFEGGYIQPNTNDERLNAAITKINEGLTEFLSIIGPYRI